MISFFMKPIITILSLLLFAALTFLIALAVYPLALLKIFSFSRAGRNKARDLMNGVAKIWCAGNSFIMTSLLGVKIEAEGFENLKPNHWYVTIANHCSALDILVLTKVLNRLSAPRFFMKAALVWLPVIGASCWVMDFPLLKRYTKEQLEKNPKLRGRDIKQLRYNCRKFMRTPVSLMMYPEGTRYTKAKAKKQKTPFKHLLKPRAGGLAMAITMMHQKLDSILDVTIAYPNGHYKFWQFLLGRTKHVIVKLKQRPITPDLIGDYQNDENFRKHLQSYINQIWKEKDELLTALLPRS